MPRPVTGPPINRMSRNGFSSHGLPSDRSDVARCLHPQGRIRTVPGSVRPSTAPTDSQANRKSKPTMPDISASWSLGTSSRRLP